MVKEKLIPFVIQNCDNGTFWDMWWHDEEKGIVCFDWTRQGNPEWHPPAVSVEWARQKGNLRGKKPRDVKAGIRNALDKKKELVKCKFSKQIEEKDGRKFKFYKFRDLKTERIKIKNPPSKKKKTTIQKNHQSEQDLEESQPPNCSSTSDFKDGYQKSEKMLHKKKDSGKRRERKKLTKAKKKQNVACTLCTKHQQENEQKNACSLPSISSFFGDRMRGTSQPILQSQTITSTYSENWFSDTTESWSSTSQQSVFFPSGPTPPPQPNDVELPNEYFNFEAQHSNSQQWYPTQYSNYRSHTGFQSQAQNIPQPCDSNLMVTSSVQQIPQLITSTSPHSFLNFQDMDECCTSVQENETRVLDVPSVESTVTELLQSEDILFLSNEIDDNQLVNAFLNGFQFDKSVIDEHLC